MSGRFIGDLILRFRKYPVDGKWFELERSFLYIAKDGTKYDIPIGINTDFATIPRGIRWLIPRVGNHGMAAVMHDWLCEKHIVSRKKADKLFLEAMTISGVGWLKRRVMYFGVRSYSIISMKK